MVYLSILLHGSPKGFFPARRGLRQGDPLLPFLFVIVGEALSHVIIAAGDMGLISGFSPSKDALSITHLKFGNNTLVFCGVEEEQLQNVKATLLCFEAVSGLKVNFFLRVSSFVGVLIPIVFLSWWIF